MTKRKTDIVAKEEPPFGHPYVLALAVIAGPDRHAIYRIKSTETTVGRSEEADFVIGDPLISSEHIEIRANGNLFSLIDLGSTNGTLLNKKRVSSDTRVRLKNFDEIDIGNTRLLFIANMYRS